MNSQTLVNLALLALQQVLALIAEIKSQSGMSDDDILAEAQKACAGNDAAYQTLKAALSSNGASPAPQQSSAS